MKDIFIRQIAIGPMMNYAYLVGAKEGKEVVAIDVAWSADDVNAKAQKEGREIVAILLTHTHFDHCNATDKLAKKINAPVYVHEKEAEELPAGLEIRTTKEGTKISIAGIDILCLHTPGHTPGSQCFLVDESIFTGDTLFVDNCGRVDLPGSSPREMTASLKRLAGLPEKIVVYPGHNYGAATHTTIGEQRKSNPYLVGNQF